MSAPHPRSRERRGSHEGIVPNKNQLHKALAQRRCSAPSLVFSKALSKPWSTGRDNSGCSLSIEQCPFVLGLTNEDSELILHECVQLTQNFKTKERYLFFFSDMLIIAKLKSGTSFRLKHKVDLHEMMAFSCDERQDEKETCAFHSTPKNALIFTWPYNGCIASFRSLDVKEVWLDTFNWQIRELGGIVGSNIPSARLLMKVLTGCNASKALNVNNMETLIECHTEADAKKLHLLAAMYSDESICHLIENNKKRKAVKSWPFTWRRSSTLSDSSLPPELKTTLFGQPLSIVCEEDSLPKPILDILTILCLKGLNTEGIFRKAANEKARKELKEELNFGRKLDLENKPVHLLAVVLKDFLRSIPHQLLSSELYHEWMAALEKPSFNERVEEMKHVADKLPRPNLLLLQHLICVLHHISKNSAINKMNSCNLAVCIGPNMLIPEHDKGLPLEAQKQINDKVITLVEFFIDNCFELFGDNISMLISAPEEDSLENIDGPELSSAHQNDSAYDSPDPELECHTRIISSYQLLQEHQWRHDRSGSEELLDQDLPASAVTRFKNTVSSMDRRCSEPNIFPTKDIMKNVVGQKLTRSHDDATIRNKEAHLSDEELSKQVPEEYCFAPLYKKKKPKGLKVNTSYPVDLSDDLLNGFSNCSLESAYSDCSVFTSSPLVSPSSPKKNVLPRHQSFSTKCQDGSDTITTGIKKHAKSFSFVTHKKMLTKTQSWGPEGEHAGLQRNTFSSSLRNKRQPECVKTFQQPEVVRLRRQKSARLISVDEVFRRVDEKNPGKPPSYDEAIHKNMCPNVSSFKSMTVHTMRATVSNKDCLTPNSTNEHNMDSSCRNSVIHSDNGHPSENEVQLGDSPVDVIQPICVSGEIRAIRGRAMSESYQKNKHECFSRRCSQPLFEIYDQIQYAKESYV
ncbi:T-cell activation Rho GTPase-activating protein [Ascaphus truei]|uniref:T-cell activation Rho GTPase-activating protein n=1 Tax=Ascaphus truei TaxID=8439 RepID=UPI003F597E2D